MKFVTLLASVLLILSALQSCNAFSLNSIKNSIIKKVKSIIPAPVQNIINDKEDDKRDERNYHNEINIE